MIVNLRGGNGSGKSFVHHALLDEHDAEPLYLAQFNTDVQQKPRVWRLPGDLYIIGRYAPGADGIGFKPLGQLVRAFAARGHVFFENVLVSANISSWLPVREALSDQAWVWATLDTPLEVCLERIQARNGGTAVKTRAIELHHLRVHKCHKQLIAAGERVATIDHTSDTVQQVHDILSSGGWDCGGHCGR